jgi:hypothetical protein
MKTRQRIVQAIAAIFLIAVLVFVFTREPKHPSLPRMEIQEKIFERDSQRSAERIKQAADAALIKGILKEDLANRQFDFATCIAAVSGKKVIPAKSRSSFPKVSAAIQSAMSSLLAEMNSPESPLRDLKRINEASRFFEDGLLARLQNIDGISCSIPLTKAGKTQRSGYPDLKLQDQETGDIYYLDPKLMASGSESSSLRTFYFEPKDSTLKITADASQLILGIEHDGNQGNWKFLSYRLVDICHLKLNLKAEFQASNKELYPAESILEEIQSE